ncbi:hypothetical protein V1505DRAFT_283195, partial [Lipomyces doorenjongii]
NLTVIKQSYWIIVVSQSKMDSSYQSQTTQQRPPRAKRLEGDSDEGPRSRSRRRLQASQTS